MGKVQEALADYFGDQASWHHAKGQEHPDDLRNERCAESLLELAAEARVLPDDHPLVVAVKDQVDDIDVVSPYSNGPWQHALSRCGFDPIRQTPSEFLVGLAAIWKDDEDTQAAEEAEEAAIEAEPDAEEANTSIAEPDALDVLRGIAVEKPINAAAMRHGVPADLWEAAEEKHLHVRLLTPIVDIDDPQYVLIELDCEGCFGPLSETKAADLAASYVIPRSI